MAFLSEFLRLSPPSQAIVLLVVGTAAWVATRLVLQVLLLAASLLPKRRAPAASEPR